LSFCAFSRAASLDSFTSLKSKLYKRLLAQIIVTPQVLYKSNVVLLKENKAYRLDFSCDIFFDHLKKEDSFLLHNSIITKLFCGTPDRLCENK
jgi:hypothetical protein